MYLKIQREAFAYDFLKYVKVFLSLIAIFLLLSLFFVKMIDI